MNIAYIFFGQVKNFNDRQFYAFDQNVKSKLSAHNVDYFLTTSKHKNYHNSRQNESEGGSRIIDPQSMQRFINFKSIFYDQIDCRDNSDIDKLAIDLVDQFGGAWGKDSIDSTKNSLRQIYSLEFFYNQFIKCGFQYDAFVLSRSDLFHTHALSVDCLHKDCDIAVPYFDDYPQIDYGWFGGINDRFAIIKNNDALKTYCTRYSRIKNKPQFYHAEKYLMNCIKQDNLIVEKIHNFEFRLLRANDVITDQIGIYPDTQLSTQLNKISKSYFINLDRRLDRLRHIRKNLPFEAQRFSAIDSKQIELSGEVKKLFPKTWHKKKKAEICCAISHYRLWKQLVLDKNADNYLILEDDVVFKPGFEKFWNEIFSTQFPKQYYLIYLGGCQPWNKPHYHKALSRYNDYFCTIKKNDYFTKDDYFWHMNASSYVLSKQGASLLCQWVDQVGMDEALDNFMQQFFNSNKMFSAPHMVIHANPLMAYQLHEENDNCELDKNSDLRFAEEKFTVNEQKENLIPKTIFQTWETGDMGGEIANLYSQELDNIKPEYYCSSILKDGDQLRVFAGVEDVDCAEFNVDIPRRKGLKTKPKLIFTHKKLFEQDFICELFDDFDIIYSEQMNVIEENSVIVYSDIYAEDINLYSSKVREKISKLRKKQKEYFEKLKNKNCILIHLSDEHCHAEIDHYKNFKHVFRQYYRKDAIADNVTFIPLGYKRGFV